jgi:hypothetical protein
MTCGGRQITRGERVMRRSFLLLAALAAAVALAAGFASSAGAYGGGASHDTWQVGLSFNCDNPASSFCQNPETGLPELGGFWGWVEFDRAADGTITGDAQLTGCGHTTGGGGPGSAGAGHEDVDITAAHLVAAGPDDPNFGTPGAQVFFVDSASSSDFLGDSGIPAEAGHYSFHPDPGVAFNLNVAFRAAK